ncbi:Hypothetical_protein [Hexamita inflata]|uniref:Hypothetical_protein n=1 Tax=Hexamita inflata TaxID=28002 RepID=A0AA86PT31_9EUKA|nr:Hypothetical protein HINF_LOCUS9080 [Hexamita inflata]CAI9940472.1 Hypothetical protein HINF_LOCUS28117 [Hexamita inflata]
MNQLLLEKVNQVAEVMYTDNLIIKTNSCLILIHTSQIKMIKLCLQCQQKIKLLEQHFKMDTKNVIQNMKAMFKNLLVSPLSQKLYQILLDGTLYIDSVDDNPLKQILLTFTKQKINTVQQFVDIVNAKFDKVYKIVYHPETNQFQEQYLNDKQYKEINYTGNLKRYILRQSNRILNNEKLEDSMQLNIKYLQIKCDQLECGMSSYLLNPENGKLEAQFGSNVLQVLCPNQMSYQSKNMDLHIKLLQNMPLNFYIQDQNNVDVDVQYILQMRFYKQDFFQQQSDSGVTAIERHTKKQLFVYLSEDNRQFKINGQFNHIAIGQAYGDIGIQEQAKTFISSYIYNLNINEYKFDILHAYKYNIENLNNSVFVWKQVPSDCLLRFDLQIYATEYDQYTIEKQQRLKTDQKPNILLRLFVK